MNIVKVQNYSNYLKLKPSIKSNAKKAAIAIEEYILPKSGNRNLFKGANVEPAIARNNRSYSWDLNFCLKTGYN